jgi:hypothetical protein
MSKSKYAIDRRQGRNGIDACGACGSSIALVPPTPDHPAMPWRCRTCDALYLAAPQKRLGTTFQGGVRQAFYMDVIERASLAAPSQQPELSSEDLLQLQQCARRVSARTGESRSQLRYPVVTPVSVLPLAADFRIAGPLATAQTIDVSCGGLGLSIANPTTAAFLAVEFLIESISMPAVILRPVRREGGGQEFTVAGEFVCRIQY